MQIWHSIEKKFLSCVFLCSVVNKGWMLLALFELAEIIQKVMILQKEELLRTLSMALFNLLDEY